MKVNEKAISRYNKFIYETGEDEFKILTHLMDKL